MNGFKLYQRKINIPFIGIFVSLDIGSTSGGSINTLVPKIDASYHRVYYRPYERNTPKNLEYKYPTRTDCSSTEYVSVDINCERSLTFTGTPNILCGQERNTV